MTDGTEIQCHKRHAKWQRVSTDRSTSLILADEDNHHNGRISRPGFNFIGAAMFGEGGFWGPSQTPNTPGDIAETEKVPLYVGLRIYEIRDINVEEETFKAHVRIIATWHPPDLSAVADILDKVPEGQTRCYIKKEDMDRFKEAAKVPQELYFFNNLEGPIDGLAQDPPFVDMATGDVHWFHVGTTTLRQSYDLQQFPFDGHELFLDLWNGFSRDMKHYDMIVHTIDFVQTGLKMAEWTFYQPIVQRKTTAHTEIRIPVFRNTYYYFINIVMFLTAFNVITLGGLVGLDTTHKTQRIAMALTMMLTAVAFKLLVVGMLPAVAYDTILDKYVLASFALEFLMASYYFLATQATERVALYIFVAAVSLVLLTYVGYGCVQTIKIHQKYGVPLTSLNVKEHKATGSYLAIRYADVFFLESPEASLGSTRFESKLAS